MDDLVERRMDLIEQLSKNDMKYKGMHKQLVILERQFDRVISSLPHEGQDIVCDFVMLCEEMSPRQLEIACTHMEFP